MIRGIPSTMNDDWQLNLWKVIKHAGKVHRNREVISYRHLLGGSIHRLNYGMMYERVCAIANALKGLGVEPGDRIAILGWNDHRVIESYFSIPGIGAVLLQLNLRLHPRELLYILNHSEPKGLFFDESLSPLAETLARDYKFNFHVIMSDKRVNEISLGLEPLYGFDELIEKSSKEYEWEEIDERSAATACYTTGTTGLPKGVYYSHRALLIHRLAGAAFVQRFDVNDVYLQVTPMYHINGHGIWIGAVMAGVKMVLPGRPTPENIVNLLIKERVTVACGIATIWKGVCEVLKRMSFKPKLNVRVESGGVEPPASLIRELREFGIQLVHSYGATETDALATHSLLKPEVADLPEEDQLKYLTKQGYPVFTTEIKLTDPSTGKELPWDGKSVGEVWIRGPAVIKEYYKDLSKSKEACTPDGWWRSGDLATIDELGYVKLIDRVKDVIKSGGEWISSVDMENFLMEHPAVFEAAVIGVPHPKWEERPLALVVLRPEYEDKPTSMVEEELKEYLLKKFAKWQLPDKILIVKEIPKTSVGKIAKRLLREQYKNVYMPTSL
ncbi:MAG: long-chain-fatty-acid--CoA ligase [Candidatus Nezhaarchaeota archaeon]|nr:long-chain-fatty-acid--CoA ligase [Candidatus Nezhaarchaeota archaeon]